MSDYIVFRVHKRALALLGLPAAALLVGLPATVLAGVVQNLTSFSNGTVADANEVNANFTALTLAVDDNSARIDALEAGGGGPTMDVELDGGVYRWADGSTASSCREYHDTTTDCSLEDGLYEIEMAGGSKVVYCDMSTDGGGWALVSRIRSNSSAHFDTGAVGTVDDPAGTAATKLSDAEINELRGPDYMQSVVRFECSNQTVYFQEDKDFVATGASASSLNRCASTWNATSWVDASPYGAHYGMQTWQAASCPYMIYYYSTDPAGCWAGSGYQDGAIWVK